MASVARLRIVGKSKGFFAAHFQWLVRGIRDLYYAKHFYLYIHIYY